MEIKDHKLKDCQWQESPNHGDNLEGGQPDSIIIHYTAGASAESSVRMMCNPRNKVSAHLVVGRDGSITQLVPFDTVAWHAGRSSWDGRDGFNKYSVGIEIDNAGRLTRAENGYKSWFGRSYEAGDVIKAVHRNESSAAFWHSFTEQQIDLVSEICETLIDAYPIELILGHDEISPNRKSDPGPAFPLEKLRQRLLQADRWEDGAEEPAPASLPGGIVTATRLNIRENASRLADTVAPPLEKGTRVDILGESDGWYEVESRTRGWVKKDYIETDNSNAGRSIT